MKFSVSNILHIFTKPKIVLFKENDGSWIVCLVESNKILGTRLKRLGRKYEDVKEAISFYQQVIGEIDEQQTYSA